ncbi:SHOCT domain-containing protein [Streptococcus alactolyticus]|uniref:SHOCT domain-containing protein n=1 Tax=Streptococcus alactolyticus TaxID=29389 RepID=UPI003D042660
MNNQNEIIYELSIRKAQKLFELNLINKADFKKLKAFLIEKYKPINPSLLGL